MRSFNEVYDAYEYATDRKKSPGEAVERVYGLLLRVGMDKGHIAVVMLGLVSYLAIRNIPNMVADEDLPKVCQYLKSAIANNPRFRVVDLLGIAYNVDEDGNVTLSGPA